MTTPTNPPPAEPAPATPTASTAPGTPKKTNTARRVAIGVAIVVVLAVASFILNRGPAPTGAGQVYFVSLGSGKLIAMPEHSLSPATLPDNGGMAFRAYVFACGDCSHDRFVGYVTGYAKKDLATVEAMGAASKDVAKDPGGGASSDPVSSIADGPPPMFIAPYTAGQKESELKFSTLTPAEELKVQASINSRCTGDKPVPCLPR